MLRVAVPNKGQLAEPAREMLREAGYLHSWSARDLVIADRDNDVEFFFLRPKDIATYVGAGTLDLGFTGRDMLMDSQAAAEEIIPLNFGRSTFRLAAPRGTATDPADLAGLRIATSYDGVLRRWLAEEGIDATVVRLDGAVENAVRLSVADAVADVVDTGNTLRQAGLEIIGKPLLLSEGILIRPASAAPDPAVDTFIRRINGVIAARTYVLVDYDIETSKLDEACRITPGLESPTISSLKDSSWSAVRAMVSRAEVHRVMDELYAMGARGILVTDIHACRL